MKLVIDIEDYDREYILNDGYHIPDTINWKIAKAIIDGTPLNEYKRAVNKIDTSAVDYYNWENECQNG